MYIYLWKKENEGEKDIMLIIIDKILVPSVKFTKKNFADNFFIVINNFDLLTDFKHYRMILVVNNINFFCNKPLIMCVTKKLNELSSLHEKHR